MITAMLLDPPRLCIKSDVDVMTEACEVGHRFFFGGWGHNAQVLRMSHLSFHHIAFEDRVAHLAYQCA